MLHVICLLRGSLAQTAPPVGLTKQEQLGHVRDMLQTKHAADQMRFEVDDVAASLKDLAEDNSQYELWTYAMQYEMTKGRAGAGLQAVRSAAEALLTDETKVSWVQGRGEGARLTAYPHLAEAARQVIQGSTPRTWSVAADAHVLLYFLNEASKQATYHISQATRLRPLHSRQWMLLATQHIAGGDWRAALDSTRKSRQYASDDYERWETDLSIGKCMYNIPGLKHEAFAVLAPLVEVAFSSEESLGLTVRDRKDAIGAQFMMVNLAFNDGDVDAATAHFESAMRRFQKLPVKVQSSITNVKALASLSMDAIRKGNIPRRRQREKAPENDGWLWVVGITILLCLCGSVILGKRFLEHQADGEAEEAGARRRGGRGRGRGHGGRGQGRGGGRGRGGGQGRGGGCAPAPAQRTDQPDWWTKLAEFHHALTEVAKEKQPNFIDETFTFEIMRNPAMLVSAGEALESYEHDKIAKWINMGTAQNPSTGSQLDPAKLSIILDKKRELEIRNWCIDKVEAWRRELEQEAASAMPAAGVVDRKVHVFIDHSNVTIGASRAGKVLDPARLVEQVEHGRKAEERIVVGSRETERARPEWARLGYDVVADPRQGKEIFVDEALHAQLMRTASRRFVPPHVMALVTGDGNTNHGRISFPECVEAALKNDWQVELYAWRHSTSQIYHQMAEEYKGHFTLHLLDEM